MFKKIKSIAQSVFLHLFLPSLARPPTSLPNMHICMCTHSHNMHTTVWLNSTIFMFILERCVDKCAFLLPIWNKNKNVWMMFNFCAYLQLHLYALAHTHQLIDSLFFTAQSTTRVVSGLTQTHTHTQPNEQLHIHTNARACIPNVHYVRVEMDATLF